MTGIATALRLSPQARTILSHLEKRGDISPMEALVTYGISRLSDAIHDIRKVGVRINTELRKDANGHGYGHYVYLKSAH